MAVVWALACMLFAACNDLLFKFFASRDRGNGYFVSIVGIVWLVVALVFVGDTPQSWSATVFWGIISGLFSVGANLLMLDAMRSLEAGVCSTIYRLNLVPVTIGAALLLHEDISTLQYCGIACACVAVCAFVPRSGSGMKKKFGWAFAVMIIASLMRAAMGLSYRYGFLHDADEKYVVVINSLFWIFGGLLYAWIRERSVKFENRKQVRDLWLMGLLSGALVTGIVITMAQSLKLGSASVVLPIAQMSFLVTGALGVWLLKEKLTVAKIFAFIAGAVSIVLLSM